MKELKNHILFRYAETIIEACSSLSYLNIDGFIFMRRFTDGSLINLTNQLKWAEDFFIRYLHGNVDVKSAQDHMLISSGVSLWSQNSENSIWKEGRNDWGFHSGISIAKPGPNWTDVVCFYSRKAPLEMDVEYLKNFYLLEKFSLCFVDRFRKIISLGENDRLMTPKIYLSSENYSPEQNKFLETLNRNSESLSIRERECIFYTAKGNTAAEVGAILHLSKRTVETYLQSAKEKLYVRKTSELVKLFPEW